MRHKLELFRLDIKLPDVEYYNSYAVAWEHGEEFMKKDAKCHSFRVSHITESDYRKELERSKDIQSHK